MAHSMNLLVVILFLFRVGCSPVGNNDQSQIRLRIDGSIQSLRKNLTVQLITPGWQKTLRGSDFGTPEAPTYSQWFETAKSGSIQAIATLKDSTGYHTSSDTVSLDIRSDWVWDVTVVLDNRNPYYGCCGCIGYRTYRVDTVFQRSASDSLFVVWGGNSIKNPVIY